MVKLKRLMLFTLALELLILSRTSAEYIWPIDGNILLNSNFAECRPNHFHAGVDINAKEGTPVKAIANGYIWHISVNPFGYGKSLFLKLDDGRIVVYAHLQRFSKKLNKLVDLEQQRRFSYRVSMYFKKDQIKVKKGETLGYTGRTGTLGPHLHFEMRDLQNRPINPMNEGYKITDSLAPVITAIQIIPLDAFSVVCGTPFPLLLKPYYNGKYYTVDDTISVNGNLGLELCVEDYQNKHSMRLNVQKIEMYVNGDQTFFSNFERFSYSDTREVELEFNYDLYRRNIGRFHRLYIYGDNHLSFYKKGSGVIPAEKMKKTSEIKIVCFDSNNNRALALLHLRKAYKKNLSEDTEKQDLKEGSFFFRNIVKIVVPYAQKTKILSIDGLENVYGALQKNANFLVGYFRLPEKTTGKCSLVIGNSKERHSFAFHYTTILRDSGGQIISTDRYCTVEIDANALYENLFARIHKTTENIPDGLTLKRGCYEIEPEGTIFNGEIGILFAYKGSPSQKMGIYKKQKDGWLYIDTRYDKSRRAYVAESKHLGTFALLEDNIPPAISDFQTLKEKQSIKKIFFKVKDIGKGFSVSEIKIKIDGVPYIPAYDPYIDEVSFLLFDQKIVEGGHTAEIKVTDRAGNNNSLSVSF